MRSTTTRPTTGSCTNSLPATRSTATRPRRSIATGFYRLGIWDDEPADKPLARYDVLDGIVSTTGQVFLGITINCARCHDHKKDPIPQRDYYRLLAFFGDVTDQDGRTLGESARPFRSR